MNFEELVNTYAIPACIVSVEKKGEDKYGEIRIIAANPGYIKDNHLPEDVVFGDLYDKYAPNDKNFEFFAFSCAVKKENLHAYVHPDRWDIWLDCNWIPLSMHDGDIYYMVYTMEMSDTMDARKLTNREADVTSEVLQTCIKLHKGDNLEETMRQVIIDIKELCSPEFCRILVRDNKTKKVMILSDTGEDEAFEQNLSLVMKKSLVGAASASDYDNMPSPESFIKDKKGFWVSTKAVVASCALPLGGSFPGGPCGKVTTQPISCVRGRRWGRSPMGIPWVGFPRVFSATW